MKNVAPIGLCLLVGFGYQNIAPMGLLIKKIFPFVMTYSRHFKLLINRNEFLYPAYR